MILFFILIFIFFSILTIKIRIDVQNFKINTTNPQYISNKYTIKITFKIFYKIPILKITINKKKIMKIINNTNIKQRIKRKIEKQKRHIIDENYKIDKNIISNIKKLNIEVKKINLKISIGTDNAAFTAIIIPILSTVIAFLFNNIKESEKEKKFEVIPLYHNKNLLIINFSTITEIELKNILNMVTRVTKNV